MFFFRFLAPTKRKKYKLRNFFCPICSSCCSLLKTFLLAKNGRVVLKLRAPNQLYLKGQNTAIHRVITGGHVFGALAILRRIVLYEYEVAFAENVRLGFRVFHREKAR
jgi:hypothetical protein